MEDTGEEMPCQDFVQEYMGIQCATFKPNTILQAFKKGGIKPLNPDIFSDHDFAPSIPISTAAHIPSSLPSSQLSTMPTSTVFNTLDDESAVESDDDDHDDDDYTNNDSDKSSDSDTSSGSSSNEGLPTPSSHLLSAISDHADG